MAYTKTTWVNGETPINATNLNKIEEGIYDVTDHDIYSTSEKQIGTWIDGKPLYRKVIETTSPSSENTNTNIYTITENMENVIDLRGYIYASNPSYKGGINVFITSTDYISTWILTSGSTPTNIRCRCANRINAPMKIVIEYTKTTD